MSLPFFFVADLNNQTIVLDEDTSKHVIQVLRKKIGDKILLTNGKGIKTIAEITDDHRKHASVTIVSTSTEAERKRKIGIAISLVKNTSRFEWFLEKATEIGVTEIIPLICERTEKEKFRFDRMQQILISAMLQSQQACLPHLHEPTEFDQVIHTNQFDQKFIAHCNEEEKKAFSEVDHQQSSIILIGPEGDFTKEEITFAIQNDFIPVTLGKTRLRTETAGMVAATLLCIA
ncbi:MAG: rRNA methyltransferase [Chitinophagaceae bacterium]